MGFPGIAFRAATHGDYELLYLRENLSGQPHATQHTPVLHGLYAWQIYAGRPWEASARWTFDSWLHVKLVVSGTRAELYVNGDSGVQVIPRLRGPAGAGEVGFVVAPGAARFANLVVRPERESPITSAPPVVHDSTPASIVRTWRVSTPFAESLMTGVADLPEIPAPTTWTTLANEERGIATLARLAGNGTDAIPSSRLSPSHPTGRARSRFDFGFSDRVRVYLNGRLLYSGNDGFGTHDPDFLGIVGLFDELALPLKRACSRPAGCRRSTARLPSVPTAQLPGAGGTIPA